ncbi:uncharacterized protein LOC143035225 [Oratosquilla oratoria]|uniref:uncharacterized protein LOC143035225 n=1 Tax=Oratosquilla oratoria TaxID=337810 RepID=UPI003F7709DD
MAGSESSEIKLDVKEEEVDSECRSPQIQYGSPQPRFGSPQPEYGSSHCVSAPPVEEDEVGENPLLAGFHFMAEPCSTGTGACNTGIAPCTTSTEPCNTSVVPCSTGISTKEHCGELVQTLRQELTEALAKLKAEQKKVLRLQHRNNDLERKNKYLQQCLDMHSGREMSCSEKDSQKARSETSETQRQRIISLHMANIQAREISRMLNIHIRTVYRWIKRHEETENIKSLPRSGAPRRTTREEDELIASTAQQQPLTNAVTLKNKIGLQVGVQTIRNRLHAAGIRNKIPAKTFSTYQNK